MFDEEYESLEEAEKVIGDEDLDLSNSITMG
jgi:hypothetical protein